MVNKLTKIVWSGDVEVSTGTLMLSYLTHLTVVSHADFLVAFRADAHEAANEIFTLKAASVGRSLTLVHI